jgi:curli production assembly/transport component CsgG
MGGAIKSVVIAMAAVTLAGCAEQLAAVAKPDEGLLPPVLNPVTTMNRSLRELPPPERRVAVAVYGYADQTGQFKPAETVQQLSRAVTQGATSVLIKALQDAGNGSWFLVVEREKLDNLLKERRIIADMRERYLGEKQINAQALPPLLFAGVLLDGGIIGFDSNTRTGGAGARYLGIGGDIQYREDTVTVYLRAISTKTGEILVSVVSHKTILSVGLKGSVFKFVAIDKILEAEAGFTHNEPDQLAVQQAIEKAVHAMIVEGAARRIWAFADKRYQDEAISRLDREQFLARAPDKAGKAGGGQPTAVASKAAPAPAAASTSQTAPAQPPADAKNVAQSQQHDGQSPQANAGRSGQQTVPTGVRAPGPTVLPEAGKLASAAVGASAEVARPGVSRPGAWSATVSPPTAPTDGEEWRVAAVKDQDGQRELAGAGAPAAGGR